MDKHMQQWCIVARTTTGYPCLVYGPFDTLDTTYAFIAREFVGSYINYDVVPSIQPLTV